MRPIRILATLPQHNTLTLIWSRVITTDSYRLDTWNRDVTYLLIQWMASNKIFRRLEGMRLSEHVSSHEKASQITILLASENIFSPLPRLLCFGCSSSAVVFPYFLKHHKMLVSFIRHKQFDKITIDTLKGTMNRKLGYTKKIVKF